MININGYRHNVGIIICNEYGKVLWAKRLGQNSWQFPQGGINFNEKLEDAMYRELLEELGLYRKDVRIISCSNSWLFYTLPKHLIRWEIKPLCIGQKQKWFLLQLMCNEKNINMNFSKKPEFDNWRWVDFWYPIHQVIYFKRDVYRSILKEFSYYLFFFKNKKIKK